MIVVFVIQERVQWVWPIAMPYSRMTHSLKAEICVHTEFLLLSFATCYYVAFKLCWPFWCFQIGAGIVKRALSYPLKLIAKNAGVNGSVVAEKVRTKPCHIC